MFLRLLSSCCIHDLSWMLDARKLRSLHNGQDSVGIDEIDILKFSWKGNVSDAVWGGYWGGH